MGVVLMMIGLVVVSGRGRFGVWVSGSCAMAKIPLSLISLGVCRLLPTPYVFVLRCSLPARIPIPMRLIWSFIYLVTRLALTLTKFQILRAGITFHNEKAGKPHVSHWAHMPQTGFCCHTPWPTFMREIQLRQLDLRRCLLIDCSQTLSCS